MYGGEIVAGRQLDDDEDDHADRDQRRHHDQQAMHQVAQHGSLPRSAARAGHRPAGRSAAAVGESVPAALRQCKSAIAAITSRATQAAASAHEREQRLLAEHARRPAGGLAGDLGLEQAGQRPRQRAPADQARSSAATLLLRRKWIGGRARSITRSTGSPRSTSAARRCRRAKWLASARTRRTGSRPRRAGARGSARARPCRPSAARVDQIVEPERGAVADHGGDVREGGPARRAGRRSAPDRAPAWRAPRG